PAPLPPSSLTPTLPSTTHPHPPPPTPPPSPYTTLFRSLDDPDDAVDLDLVRITPRQLPHDAALSTSFGFGGHDVSLVVAAEAERSEEHTSELQSRRDLVCRLLLEKKKYGRGWWWGWVDE